MIKKNSFALLWYLFVVVSMAPAADNVVINEIHYHPIDDAPTEFIELYNPTTAPVDVSNYAFIDGISFTIPGGTVIPSKGFLLVVQDPSSNEWRGLSKTGPYIGKLSNQGEEIVLRAPDGRTIDSFSYSDYSPWPRGADGYGSSLERIDPDLNSNDYHSWRASLEEGGTPGKQNSVINVPHKPVLLSYQTIPAFPTSKKPIQIQVFLDGAEDIQDAELRIETVTTNSRDASSFTAPMTRMEESVDIVKYNADITAQPSQTLVRFSIDVTLVNGNHLRLPHVSEPRPFESFFVYDNDIPSKLPILWMFPPRTTKLSSQLKIVTGVAIKPLDQDFVSVYDCAAITDSRNGQKVKFLKGEEHRGDRTLNISLESPLEGTTAGPQSPHVEHISYRLFGDFGVLTLRCDWYRVIARGGHEQRIAVQQPNEQFIKMNGRDSDGNIYKIAYNEPGGYSKKTNIYEDHSDYQELFQYVNINNNRNLAESLRKYLAIEEVMGYEVALNLLSHWDGIKNNIFLYHNPEPIDRWEIIPWDVDKTFGYTDSDPMFWKMPIDFPLTGDAPGSPELISRNLVGPIGRPFHMDSELHQEYKKRVEEALSGLFSIERVEGMIQEAEDLLNEDLDLIESYTGMTRSSRRNQIKESYDTMRTFLYRRHEYLRSQLPTSFTFTRKTPRQSFHAGETLAGNELEVTSREGNPIHLTVAENIPNGFSVTYVHTDTGTFQVINGSIVWELTDVTGAAVLTYDITAHASNPPLTTQITGTILEDEVSYSTGMVELNYLPENEDELGADWTIGAGEWTVIDGVLNCRSNTSDDPKHVWIERDFGVSDYIVKADVRMMNWVDTDYARSGAAVCVNPADNENALNIVLHEDLGSVDLLNDHVMWGTRESYSWEIGEWYTMTLQLVGTVLKGSIKKTGTAENPYPITWNESRNTSRAPGYPGLTGPSLDGLTAQFDNFEVIVDGNVVFSDDFNRNVAVQNWELHD